jgi:hypothetical protein
MMNTTRALLEQAMHLPLAERAKLIDDLLESMHDADPVVDAKWVLEARASGCLSRRRAERHRRGRGAEEPACVRARFLSVAAIELADAIAQYEAIDP